MSYTAFCSSQGDKDMGVFYEWDLETWDETDCLDHLHADRLRDLPTPANDKDKLVLVRDVGDQTQGLTDRLWAYVDNESRMLPKYFSDSGNELTNVKVPQRFHREIAREMAR
jgi:hypothetical protein